MSLIILKNFTCIINFFSVFVKKGYWIFWNVFFCLSIWSCDFGVFTPLVICIPLIYFQISHRPCIPGINHIWSFLLPSLPFAHPFSFPASLSFSSVLGMNPGPCAHRWLTTELHIQPKSVSIDYVFLGISHFTWII